MRRLIQPLAVLSLLASPLRAQELKCSDTETLIACRDRLDSTLNAAINPTAGTGADTLSSALAGKTTGITSLGNGFSSSIGDFLPAIAGALGLTQTTTEDGATSLETNLRIPFGSSLQKVRLQAVLRRPVLYEPLRQSLPAATRDARSQALEKELGDFDDVQANLAWNLENRTFGRSFDIARPMVTAVLREKLGEIETTAATLSAQRRYSDELRNSESGVEPGSASLPECQWEVNRVERNMPISCFTADERLRLTGALFDLLRVTRKGEEQLSGLLRETGFYALPDLVNNQPQLSVEASAALRRDLVGPNGFSVTARYEGGFANFNGLREYGRNTCNASQDAAISATCLRGYLAEPAVQSALKRGDRFFVTAEFTRRQDYQITLATDSVSLALRGTWDVTASAGFGRYMAFSKSGEQLGRLDLSAEYVMHHDDPTRQNRLVAAGTFTYRISPSLSIAAGLSYASKPEFLGDVDKKFGANFGLRYKVLKS